MSPLPSQAVTGFTSFDKGPSFSFPDFEIDGKSDLIILEQILDCFYLTNILSKVSKDLAV